MGFLGSFGRALGAPLRALPGGKTLAKPLNKSPLGRRVNNKLGMNNPKKPIGPSPQMMQGQMAQAASQSPMQMKAPPPMEAPEAVPGVQESIQAAPSIPMGQGQEMPQIQMPQMSGSLSDMLAQRSGGNTGVTGGPGAMLAKQKYQQQMGGDVVNYNPGIGPRWKMY